MKTPFRGYAAWALGAIALLGLTFTVPAAAEDEDSGGRRWFLEMAHGPLKTVIVERSGSRADAYHYMTIAVENPTTQPRPWNPLIKAITDTKDPKGGNRTYIAGGFTDALAQIRRAEGDKSIRPINETCGTLAAGEKVKTVAIFGVLDSLYDTIDIEIHGLVDAVATYKVEMYGGAEVADGDEITPATDWVIVDSAYWDRNKKVEARLRKANDSGSLPAPESDYVVVSERRYWAMRYERLGDEFRAEDDLIKFIAQGWAIQGNPKKLRSVTKPTDG